MNAIEGYFEHSLVLPFFGIGMQTDFFQSCGHCWVFKICWHIEYSIFTASSFRIWNSSTGIPSPPLTLYVMMLPKAHLTSHSRMSGFRWVIIRSWLSGSWRSFLYSSSVCSCHLFSMSSSIVVHQFLFMLHLTMFFEGLLCARNFTMCLAWIIQLKPSLDRQFKNYYSLILTDEEIEAWGGKWMCSRSR